MGLTGKRKVFIEEYIGRAQFSATEAARRAGYKHPRRQGSRLLTFVDVREEIQRRLKEAAMSADEVLAKLTDQARTDIGPYVTQEGKRLALDWAALKEAGLTHLVKSIIPTAHGTKIEFHDAQTALVQMGRAHGVFKDKQEFGLDESTKQLLAPFFALAVRCITNPDMLEAFKDGLKKIEAGENGP